MVGDKTTTEKRDSLIEMFLDATVGEVYCQGRLKTRQSGDSIELVAYHREIIAEYDPATGNVFVFAGHHGNSSKTVDRYISRVTKLAGQRSERNVILTEVAPVARRQPVARSARNISEYVGFDRKLSSAEKREIRDVNHALARQL